MDERDKSKTETNTQPTLDELALLIGYQRIELFMYNKQVAEKDKIIGHLKKKLDEALK